MIRPKRTAKKSGITVRLALAGLVLLAPTAILRAQETAVSERFRLDGGFSAASGPSLSESFHLSACLCEGIGGFAASESFHVLAGCVAFLPAGAARPPRPEPPPHPKLSLSAAASPPGWGVAEVAAVSAERLPAALPAQARHRE